LVRYGVDCIVAFVNDNLFIVVPQKNASPTLLRLKH
jgi:hypothetical protein